MLGSFSGDSTIPHNLSITPGDVDWYTFTTVGASTNANYVGLNFDPSLGLIDAEVFNSSNELVGRADDASYFQSDLGVEARIALPTEPAGTYTYYVAVYGLNGATSPDYGLNFFLPGATPPSSPNDTQTAALNLGNITGINTVTTPSSGYIGPPYSVAILSPTDQNWFEFTLQQAPVAGDSVSIATTDAFGSLELDVLAPNSNDPNNPISITATTTGGVAEISLTGNSQPAAGTYYVEVSGYQGGTAGSYTIQINAPGGDRFEPDNTQATAHDLDDPPVGTMGGGNVHGFETWGDLSIEPQRRARP